MDLGKFPEPYVFTQREAPPCTAPSGGSFHIDAGEGLLLPAQLAVDCTCDGSFAVVAMNATEAPWLRVGAAKRSWLELSHEQAIRKIL